MSSVIEQVREHFKANPGARFANADLSKALDVESQPISTALNVLYNNSEIQRVKREGYGYEYWLTGSAPAPKAPAPIPPKDIVNRVMSDRALPKPGDVKATKKRGRPKNTPGPAPKKVKAKKVKPAKKIKVAKPKKSDIAVALQAAGRATPWDNPEGGGVAFPDGEANFAIRHNGELGISGIDGSSVTLPRAEVQRLRAFLVTVASLWQ